MEWSKRETEWTAKYPRPFAFVRILFRVHGKFLFYARDARRCCVIALCLCGIDVTTNWRITQSESRARYLRKYTEEEVESYESWISQMTEEDIDAVLQDIASSFALKPGMKVLDVGAGTGAVLQILHRVEGLDCSALEPSPAMLSKLRSKSDCRPNETAQGFCDGPSDASHFPAETFDVIVGRHVVNGLYDPLTAFRHWSHWLKPGGSLLIMEALFGRDAWKGIWAEEVDQLPFSACQSQAMLPYLLELVGFEIQHVGPMMATNLRPTTKTSRYWVHATKSVGI